MTETAETPSADDGTVEIPGFDLALRWDVRPASWSLEDGPALTIEAGPETDLWADPSREDVGLNAPRLLGEVTGDFQFHAVVRVGFGETLDAGALVLWLDDRTWAKIEVEKTPRGWPQVVSVVTRGGSDAAYAFSIGGETVGLRISRIGPTFAFHAMTNLLTWHLVRVFSLDAGPTCRVGFLAQSPLGAGSSTTFTAMRLILEAPADLYDGK